MKKLFKAMIPVFLIALTLTACNKTADNNDTENINVDDLVEKIQQELAKRGDGLEYKDGEIIETASGATVYVKMDVKDTEETPIFVPSVSHLNQDDIEKGYVIQPFLAMLKSELIFVLEGKDEAAAKRIEESLGKVLEDQESTWSTYLPDQHEFVKNNKIIRKGNVVVYITSEHVNELEALV